MTVYESDLPGVGKKFEVELGGERRLVVVIHNTGKRELFVRESSDADAEKLFELSDQLARQVGTIMEGTYFQPVETDRIETVLEGDTVIEWVNVPEGSPLVGQTLADARLRQETGASVIAIRRDGETIDNPEGSTTVETGDTLIALGTREACRTLLDRASDGDDTPPEAGDGPDADGADVDADADGTDVDADADGPRDGGRDER